MTRDATTDAPAIDDETIPDADAFTGEDCTAFVAIIRTRMRLRDEPPPLVKRVLLDFLGRLAGRREHEDCLMTDADYADLLAATRYRRPLAFEAMVEQLFVEQLHWARRERCMLPRLTERFDA